VQNVRTMAGIDLDTANAKLTAYLNAEAAVLSGQRYKIDNRELYRADLAEIRKGIDYWNGWVQRLDARSRGRSAAIVPRPTF